MKKTTSPIRSITHPATEPAIKSSKMELKINVNELEYFENKIVMSYKTRTLTHKTSRYISISVNYLKRLNCPFN